VSQILSTGFKSGGLIIDSTKNGGIGKEAAVVKGKPGSVLKEGPGGGREGKTKTPKEKEQDSARGQKNRKKGKKGRKN